MAADLAEEHSTATLATERLEAEQAERMKLEKDKGDLEVMQTVFLLFTSPLKILIFSIETNNSIRLMSEWRWS